MNAFANRLLSRNVATVVGTPNQAAVLTVVSCWYAIRIDAFAPSWIVLVVALAVLAAVRAVLNLNGVDVYVAKTVWTVVLVTTVAVDSVLAGTAR